MLPLQADSDSDTTDRRQQNRQPKIETNVVIENNNNGNRTSDIIDDNDIKNEVINDNDINRNRNSQYSNDQNIINNNSSSSRAESPSPLPTPDLEEFSRQCFKLAADLSPDQDPKQHPLRALSESNLTVVSSFQGETGDQEAEQEVVIHEFIVALH